LISARGLFKQIGPKTILHGIDLEVGDGEFVTLLGPNGAGKTTLLKILSGVSSPSAGELYIDGVKVGREALKVRQKVGVLSHNTFLYPNLSARDNLKFYGQLYGVKNLEQRINDTITEVGLEYALADPVRVFSRGMQQRLSIARAILHDPEILLLDEPYTGLDQHAVEILNHVLLNLSRRQRTIILVTHNFDLGLNLSDRVLILNRGRLVWQCPARGLELTALKTIYLDFVGGSADVR